MEHILNLFIIISIAGLSPQACNSDADCHNAYSSYCNHCSLLDNACVVDEPCTAECYFAGSCSYGYACNETGHCYEDPTFCHASRGCVCADALEVCYDNYGVSCNESSTCSYQYICFQGSCADPNTTCVIDNDCKDGYKCREHYCDQVYDYHLAEIIGLSCVLPFIYVLVYAIIITVLVCRFQKRKAFLRRTVSVGQVIPAGEQIVVGMNSLNGDSQNIKS